MVEEVQKVKETIIEIAKPIIQEKIIEIPEIEYRDKIVEKVEKIVQEKIKEVPRIEYQERIVEIPRVITQEKVVEVRDFKWFLHLIDSTSMDHFSTCDFRFQKLNIVK